MSRCTHLEQIRELPVATRECADCIRAGARWVHLRQCLTCGYVGCCDSSENHHALRHFHETAHPIIASLEPNEDWRWCYADELPV